MRVPPRSLPRVLALLAAIGSGPVAGAAMAIMARPLAAQESHLLVIGGLRGTPEMGERFQAWEDQVVTAATERFGLSKENVTYLAPEPAAAPARIAGESTAENVEGAIQEIASGAGPGDRVLIVLFGHGSFDGERSLFSLPGPDFSAQEFAALLEPFTDQTVAVVNTASASGEWVAALSGPRRIVVTATSTGRERNATEFGSFFADALSSDATDIDMDGTVSLLEAFEYAQTEVARHYEEQNLILTEHARLDDDGDGEGSGTPSIQEGDGSLAASFRLLPSTAELAGDDPELRSLYDERLRLEEEVRDLRALNESLDPETYDATLADLLLELARINRQIEEREGTEPQP